MPGYTPRNKGGDPSDWQNVRPCGKGHIGHRDRRRSAFQDSRAEQFAAAWVFQYPRGISSGGEDS